MLKKIGVNAKRGQSAADIAAAKKLILPGVGAFDHCMEKLQKSGLRPALEQAAHTAHIPVLGICVGFQMLFQRSQEGTLAGLGWIDGEVIRFDSAKLGAHHKIPHMGWSEIRYTARQPLFMDMDKPRFYFVHSYHAIANRPEDSIATCHYGYDFCSAVRKDNMVGVQFHPEKSHRYGMQLLRNFVAWSPHDKA